MKKFDEAKELGARLEVERGWHDRLSWVEPGPWDTLCGLGVPQKDEPREGESEMRGGGEVAASLRLLVV